MQKAASPLPNSWAALPGTQTSQCVARDSRREQQGGDPSETAVDRFLKWIEDPVR